MPLYTGGTAPIFQTWAVTPTASISNGNWIIRRMYQMPSSTAASTVITVPVGTTIGTMIWYDDNNEMAVWSGSQYAWRPVAPAIRRVTERELLEQDHHAYAKALQEHNDQEAARLLRQITEREQAEAARQLARVQAEQQQQQERERRTIADNRANQLLLDHLTPQQQETLKKNGWFIVEGGRSKRQYRIRKDTLVANVDALDPTTKLIRVTHRLCGHVPHGQIPMGDHLLAQKMMLEFAEDDFLRIANQHPR